MDNERSISLPLVKRRLDLYCRRLYPHMYEDLKRDLFRRMRSLSLKIYKPTGKLPPKPLMPPNTTVSVCGLLILSREKTNPKILNIQCVGPAPKNVKPIISQKQNNLDFQTFQSTINSYQSIKNQTK